MGKDIHLGMIKTSAKCSGYSYQRRISSLLCSSRRHQSHLTSGLVEVKRDDFKQGFAQATVQMESSLKCREYDMDKVWGIVTDAEKWYFMLMRRESHRLSCQNQ